MQARALKQYNNEMHNRTSNYKLGSPINNNSSMKPQQTITSTQNDNLQLAVDQRKRTNALLIEITDDEDDDSEPEVVMMPPLPIKRDSSDESRPLFEITADEDMLNQVRTYDSAGQNSKMIFEQQLQARV